MRDTRRVPMAVNDTKSSSRHPSFISRCTEAVISTVDSASPACTSRTLSVAVSIVSPRTETSSSLKVWHVASDTGADADSEGTTTVFSGVHSVANELATADDGIHMSPPFFEASKTSRGRHPKYSDTSAPPRAGSNPYLAFNSGIVDSIVVGMLTLVPNRCKTWIPKNSSISSNVISSSVSKNPEMTGRDTVLLWKSITGGRIDNESVCCVSAMNVS